MHHLIDERIWSQILPRATTEDVVQTKAKQFGFESELTYEEYSDLYNALFRDTKNAIRTFLNSDEAKNLYDRVDIFCPVQMYHNGIRNGVSRAIHEQFKVQERPQPSCSSWLWSRLGW